MKEAQVESVFVRHLVDRGWQVTTANPNYTDVVAKRGAELLIAEVKGHTSSVGTDVDTLYGQLLRRMLPSLQEHTRFAVVVPESMAQAAMRVPEHVRTSLDVDVYLVSDFGVVRLLEDQA